MKASGLKFAWVGAFAYVVLAIGQHAAAEQMKPRRSPGPAYWSDNGTGVGQFSSPQAACDFQGNLIHSALTYVPQASYKGLCVYSSKPTDFGHPGGFTFFGQECPLGYSMRNSVEGFGPGFFGRGQYYGPDQYCESNTPLVDRWHDKPQLACDGFGNPIFPLTGTKRQTEPLLRWPDGRALTITYDNRRKLPGTDPDGAFGQTAAPSFGPLWETNTHKRVVAQSGGLETAHYTHVQASRGSGQWISFLVRSPYADPPLVPDSDVPDRIWHSGSGWLYVDANTLTQETYSAQGLIQQAAYAQGGKLTYTYSDASTPASVAPATGLLIQLQDAFGRSVRFEYEQPAGVPAPRIVRIVDPDQRAIRASYDAAGNLTTLTWQDDQVRQFVYEQSALPWALTGVVDENNQRYSTFGYDTDGHATSTEHAGGVDRYSVSYGSAPRWVNVETLDPTLVTIWRDHSWQLPQGAVLTTPNGSSVSLDAALVNGMPRGTTRSQPAGAGCAASTRTRSYDANGNVASHVDFNGSKTCHSYDLSRNLRTLSVEGLAATDACPADLAGYTVPAGTAQRKTSVRYHPDWALETQRAEAKRLITLVYNGQPDPSNNNAVASCAPSNATLPNGARIAVLCKKIERATTDDTGSQGFNATPTGTARTWTYTYNAFGQVLTERDPRGNQTTYAYYADTTADHTVGDLQTFTNAAGHVIRYTRYDKSGRLLQSVDPNGLTTDTAYTPRGWVDHITVTPPGGGTAQLTQYSYDGVGQLKTLTLPDKSTLQYTYDAAQRLTDIQDAAGNTVHYTLDNEGNRLKEELKDASGALARTISRSFDALNRLQSETGGMQ